VSEESKPPLPGSTIAPPPPPPAAQPSDELTRKVSDALNEVLMKAQEVSFELATLECKEAPNCPLAKTTRELVVGLKKLFNVSRQASR